MLPVDPDEVRTLAIRAVFADSVLLDQLVLKGGTALYLVHGIGTRSSLDLDLSLKEDFEDARDAQDRLMASLSRTFEERGYLAFDYTFRTRPSAMREPQGRRWGGYELTFKLIPLSDFTGDIERARRQSTVVGPGFLRRIRIQISRFEFCGEPAEVSIDDQTVVVYTPAMIAIEKLRAICQQLPAYPYRRNPAPRARDFYDIHSIRREAHIRLGSPANLELIRQSFAAKEADLGLIRQVGASREFHRPDWPSVEASVADPGLQDFDFYFDELIREIDTLKVLWVENAP